MMDSPGLCQSTVSCPSCRLEFQLRGALRNRTQATRRPRRKRSTRSNAGGRRQHSKSARRACEPSGTTNQQVRLICVRGFAQVAARDFSHFLVATLVEPRLFSAPFKMCRARATRNRENRPDWIVENNGRTNRSGQTRAIARTARGRRRPSVPLLTHARTQTPIAGLIDPISLAPPRLPTTTSTARTRRAAATCFGRPSAAPDILES
jgi:hypothetical protein